MVILFCWRPYQPLIVILPPCLTLSNIRYVSRVKWSNLEKGLALSSTPRCSSYWKGSHLVAFDYGRQLHFLLTILFRILCLIISYFLFLKRFSKKIKIASLTILDCILFIKKYCKIQLGSQYGTRKKSHSAVTKWCTGREWPVNCMTIISARWRSNMPFQRRRKCIFRWPVMGRDPGGVEAYPYLHVGVWW